MFQVQFSLGSMDLIKPMVRPDEYTSPVGNKACIPHDKIKENDEESNPVAVAAPTDNVVINTTAASHELNGEKEYCIACRMMVNGVIFYVYLGHYCTRVDKKKFVKKDSKLPTYIQVVYGGGGGV